MGLSNSKQQPQRRTSANSNCRANQASQGSARAGGAKKTTTGKPTSLTDSSSDSDPAIKVSRNLKEETQSELCNDERSSSFGELFRPLKASEIRTHITSGGVGKEWSELLKEEMMDTRDVAVHMQKDRYYGRFVYEHSRVRLGGGYKNSDYLLSCQCDQSPCVSPIKCSTSTTSAAAEEEEEEEILCGVEADSGSNDREELCGRAENTQPSCPIGGLDEESSATVYSECDIIDGSKNTSPSKVATDVFGVEEESSELFPSYPGSSEDDEEDDIEENDYINANFLVDGKYICTQAPVPETLVDFWRMVWEQRVDLIVMLTRLKEGEREKADRYWPTMEKLYKSYKGKFQVTILSEKVLVEDEIVVRRLALKDVRVVIPLELSTDAEEESDGGDEEEDSDIMKTNPALEEDEEDVDPDARVITQLHYIGWPDHGVPNNFVYILEMLKLVDAQQKKQEEIRELLKKTKSVKSNGVVKGKRKIEKESEVIDGLPPIIVHCSAGVGRSGTFVVAHMELVRLQSIYRERYGDDGIEAEKWRDLLNEEEFRVGEAVKLLRKDRRTMVQREEQFLFLYELFEHMATQESAIIPFTSAVDCEK